MNYIKLQNATINSKHILSISKSTTTVEEGTIYALCIYFDCNQQPLIIAYATEQERDADYDNTCEAFC